MTYRKKAAAEESSGFGWLPWILLCLCAYVFIANVTTQVNPRPVIEDKTSLPSGYVILIHQRQPMSADEVLMIDQLEEMHKTSPKFEYRSVDAIDKSPAVIERIEWAAKKGVKPPLALWQNESGEPVRVIPMPKTIDGLKKVWK